MDNTQPAQTPTEVPVSPAPENPPPLPPSPTTNTSPQQPSSKPNYRILGILGLLALFTIVLVAVNVIPKSNTQEEQKQAALPAPSFTPTPTINNRFFSVAGPNDKILDSLPKKIEPGTVYFYKNATEREKIDSYLKGKITTVNAEQKSLSVNSTSETGKILIFAKDYTVVTSVKLNSNPSKPIVKNISFTDLKVGDEISVFNLQYNNQGYFAGNITIIIKEK